MITTEALLTRPEGFGIATATPAQRAVCRILDGRPLGDLRDHPDVAALVGGPEALAQLEQRLCGVMPTEVVFLASIRSAKTIIACAAAIRATQTVDVSRLGPGEVPRVSIVSLKLDVSAVARTMLLETLRSSEVLSALLVDDKGEAIVVRHPSGRLIEIACVAGAKAGGGLVARWSAGVIFDEAPRMNGATDAVVNLDHARSAILGRLLPGAQALYIGSAWAPHGPVYELVQEHWQKPTSGVVVLRGTGPMLNPKWWTPERCADLQERDPVAFQTDVQGEFADPESGLLNPLAIKHNTRESPLELTYEDGARYCAAVDPSEGGAGSNGFALVILQAIQPEEAKPAWLPRWVGNVAPLADWRNKPKDTSERPMKRFRVALVREFRGRPENIWKEIAAICQRYRLTQAWTDQYAAAANKDLARRYGLTVSIDPITASSKLEDFTNLATLISTDLIELSPDPVLRRDLLSVKKRITQQGTTIVLPRTSDGRHCDYAPALASAVKHGRSTGPTVLSGIHVHGI